MPKFIISVKHQLDRVGSEFMDEEQSEIVVQFDAQGGNQMLECTIMGIPDCYINKADLESLVAALKNVENKA